MLTSWLAHGPPMRIIYKDIPILRTSQRTRIQGSCSRRNVRVASANLRQAIMQSPPELTEASLHSPR